MSNKEEMQSLFNTSLEHIRKQGKPSRKGKICVYKTEDGLGCAAAPFIKTYRPEMDSGNGICFSHICSQFPDNVVKEAFANMYFVDQLQNCHDRIDTYSDFMTQYEINMKNLAERFDLFYTPAA